MRLFQALRRRKYRSVNGLARLDNPVAGSPVPDRSSGVTRHDGVHDRGRISEVFQRPRYVTAMSRHRVASMLVGIWCTAVPEHLGIGHITMAPRHGRRGKGRVHGQRSAGVTATWEDGGTPWHPGLQEASGGW